MSAFKRLTAWLRISRDQATRPGDDDQFRQWLHRETATDRATRKVLDALHGRESVLDELDRQAYALGLHDVSQATTTPLRLVDILQAAARWRAEVNDLDARRARWALEHQKRTEEIDQLRELLGVLWLYVDWRYVTKQLDTEQKNLWADCVDATPGSDGTRAERWWTS